MKPGTSVYSLKLLGAFRLTDPDGRAVAVASRRGMALITMLALSDDGERTRPWLQEKLWGSRQPEQARGSLRRELSNLRKLLPHGERPILDCRRDRVVLDFSRVVIDARAVAAGAGGACAGLGARELLEGFDLSGENAFEDWLREQRRALSDVLPARGDSPVPALLPVPPAAPPAELPTGIIDLTRPAPGFADQPALAVLPFVNLTSDPAHDWLAEGLGDDLIDRASRLRWLPVISRASASAVAAQGLDPAEIGRRLGAKYLFEGRLRRIDDGFDLSVELTEAASRRVLWARRIQPGALGSREVQTGIVSALVGALDTRIDAAEQRYDAGEPSSDLGVAELIWRGRWHINQLTREHAERARFLFDRALELAPDSAEALIQAAWALGRAVWAERRSPEDVVRMRALAQRAIRADPEDGRGHWLAGAAEMWSRNPRRAEILLRRAIELNPSLAEAHSTLGDALTWNSRPEEALESLRASLRLNPTDLLVFTTLSCMATAYWMLGRRAEALEHAEQSVVRRPGYWYAHAVKAAVLEEAGHEAEAAAAFADLVQAKPEFRADWIEWVPFIDRAWTARLRQAVARAAGERSPPGSNPEG